MAVKDLLVELKDAIKDCKEIKNAFIKIVGLFKNFNVFTFCFELLYNGF